MTPPDSDAVKKCRCGEPAMHGDSLCVYCWSVLGSKPASKPDSDAREVCSVCLREKVVRGDGLQEDRCWRGFLGEDDRKCYQLGYERLAALVGVEPSLAQRILAALEGEAAFLHNEGKESGSCMLYALAAELRAVIGK